MQPATPAQIDAAHPRSRGENQVSHLFGVRARGSSPLTRGKPRSMIWASIGSGLIPAHAGKTASSSCRPDTSTAHPRSRGENPPGHPGPQGDQGSSPLTRGKPLLISPSLPVSRLIPAHAGKTLRTIANRAFMTAHPRSRGENLVGLNSGPELGGSSPLTRGKLARPHPRQPGPRLIPAHAGKTTSPRGMRPSGQAHPRSRGENPPRKPLWTSTWGSSPLTRGKRAVAPGIERDLRLIPAHAGKTVAPGT